MPCNDPTCQFCQSGLPCFQKPPKTPPKAKKPLKKRLTPERLEDIEEDKEFRAVILAARPHVCEECGIAKGQLDVSHLLSKGAHPELRHDPENAVLHCRKCHQRWEFEGGFRKGSATYARHITYIQSKSML